MDQATFLRSLQLAFRELSTDRLSREQIRLTTGIPEPELGELLEEAMGLGFITGAKVAEERGPIQAISLTPDGRRIAQSVFSDDQSYLGYQITAQPTVTTGSANGEIFEARRNGELAVRLSFSVTYTAAGVAGERADQLALELGHSYLRGLLLSGDFEPGSSISHTIDSTNLRATNQMSDGGVEEAVLAALGQMLTAEARSSEVPFLDVDGLALYLDVDALRIAETLTRLEVMGQVESNAATFERPMNRGACRITATGLRRLPYSTDSRPASAPAPAPAPATEGDPSPEEANEASRPRVFISYSHDGEEHDAAVRRLAARLRAWGVDVEFDQYEQSPPAGWLRWMVDMIEWADFVLVVCTEAYRRRAMGREEDGIGLGATYEGTLINQEIFERGGENDKFIPVVLRREDLEHRPEWLRSYTHYDVGDESSFEDLYRHLTSQPAVLRPDLGDLVDMPPVSDGIAGVELPSDNRANTGADLDAWRLDLCYLWEEDAGRTRYLVSWTPSRGFFTSEDTAVSLSGMSGVLTPAELDVAEGVSVGYLPGRSLHVEFNNPAHKVGGRLQTSAGTIEPTAQGGGAREYLSWNLERLPDLN